MPHALSVTAVKQKTAVRITTKHVTLAQCVDMKLEQKKNKYSVHFHSVEEKGGAETQLRVCFDRVVVQEVHEAKHVCNLQLGLLPG